MPAFANRKISSVATDIETEIPKFQYHPRKFFFPAWGAIWGYSGFCREKIRGMRNAYYARDNFDVRRGGRCFSCAVKNTLISQKDAVDTRTFRVKPNTPKLLSMPGKNGGQLWDLPSISMSVADIKNCFIVCSLQCDLYNVFLGVKMGGLGG